MSPSVPLRVRALPDPIAGLRATEAAGVGRGMEGHLHQLKGLIKATPSSAVLKGQLRGRNIAHAIQCDPC